MTTLEDAKSKLMEVYLRGGYQHSKHAVNYVPTHFPRFKHTIDQLVPQLKPGSDILDLGAAPFIVPECLSKLGHTVVGGDFCASDWLEPGLLSFETVQLDCNGKKLPFDDRAFDCVVFCEVFEHMNKNLNLTMREILRVLKPGGMLYLTTPNLKAVRSIVRLIRKGRMPGDIYDCWVGAENDGMMGHIREYTPLEMATYLPKIGFTNVKVKTINVYEKAAFETLAWRAITFPFANGKETISVFAFRP